MGITLENCGILKEDILNGVVNQLVEPLEEEIRDAAILAAEKKTKELVGKQVETIVADAIMAKVKELMASEVQPLNIWGEKRGRPRTISDILSDSLKEFWSQQVDKNGVVTDRYGNQPRIEYMVKQVANEVLNDQKHEFNQIILNAKASLSDGLTKAVKEITDAHMGIKRK